MMKSRHKNMLMLLGCLLLAAVSQAEPFNAPECRPLELVESSYQGPEGYAHGLLWKISMADQQPSYIFGTIHVADAEILDLPGAVSEALNKSRIFVMETVPDAGQMMALSGMLFFSDGRSLQELVSPQLFSRTVDILQDYFIPGEVADLMKPWAAFMTINYPPGAGTVLDVELMNIALNGGAAIHGLETMQEQLDIFDQMPLDSQVTLLTDTVCNYDLVLDDITTMKRLYLDRNLKGLYEYSNRYSVQDETVYKELMDMLLIKRNHIMVSRMQPMLDEGQAFIAIGAMHLPGEEGVLNLLGKQGFDISAVY
jgi:hypothetical protein